MRLIKLARSLIRWNSTKTLLVLFLLIPSFSNSATLIKEREFKPRSKSIVDPFLIPEYVLRLAFFPLQKLVEADEKYYLHQRVIELISNEDKTIWLYPTLLFSTRDGFSIGARYLHKNILHDKDRVKLGGSIYENRDSKADISYKARRFKSANLKLSYEDDSNEKYFGKGPNSSSLNNSVYSIRSMQVDLSREFKIVTKQTRIGFNLAYEEHRTSSGESSSRSSSENLFSLSELRGFSEQINYFSPTVFLTYDGRAEIAHPTRGGFIQLAYTKGHVTNGLDFDYERVDLRMSQLFEVETTRRTFVVGARYSTVSGNAPFYKLATLDQKTPLRGYENGRFIDNRFLVGNLEYRFKIWETLEPKNAFALGNLFFDAGQVFDESSELSISNTRLGGGIGFSLGVSDFVLYRLQLAYGEGVNITFGVNQAF